MKSKELKNKFWNRFISYKDNSYVNTLTQNDYTIMFMASFTGKDHKWYNEDVVFWKGNDSRRYYPVLCMTVVNINDFYTLIGDNVTAIVSSCSNKMLGCGCEEWIITNGECFIFLSDITKDTKIYDIESAWERIINMITNKVPFSYLGIWDFVVNQVSKSQDYPSEDLHGLISKLDFKDEDFISSNNTFSLKPEKEFELMKTILFKDNHLPLKGQICRYISISGFKRMLIDDEFTMSGLAGMNDSSEIDVLKILATHDYKAKETLPLPHFIAEDNSYFINSFCRSEKDDDLTMWRLYGDDGKGVCLTFDYSLDKISAESGLFLFPVTYRTEIPIEILKLLNPLDENISVCNRSFRIANINLWKHFLKPEEFKDEDEVRLLLYAGDNNSCIGNVSWILNSNNQIFHPIFKFKSPKKYPLRLTKVCLGPKFPYCEVNFNQIAYLLRQYNNTIITKSKCRYYR